MKILWVSDSPTSPSGFGAVTRAVAKRLADRGHRVEIVGWQARGTTARWDGIPVHPVHRDAFGADALLGYLHRIQPDFLITLADVWWMSFLTDPPIQQYLDMSRTRWALYYPIDGTDADGRLPPGWITMLQTADVPIAMSRFGVEVSAACGVDAAYVPHGCDVDVFAPPADKDAAKARLGYGGRFVVLSDARNQPRKLLPRTLEIAVAASGARSRMRASRTADGRSSISADGARRRPRPIRPRRGAARAAAGRPRAASPCVAPRFRRLAGGALFGSASRRRSRAGRSAGTPPAGTGARRPGSGSSRGRA